MISFDAPEKKRKTVKYEPTLTLIITSGQISLLKYENKIVEDE